MPNSESTTTTPRPVRLAAALIVLRDGNQGLETLLLRRADKANDQNSGATVFPGGLVDSFDRHLHAHCAGIDDASASARLSLAEGGLDSYAAAVRECFEEAGVLFACDADGQLVELDRHSAAELDAMRQAAVAGTDALLSLCDAHGWRLAADRLAYFSHWLTPPGMARRYDTRFFVALMPPGQTPRHDGQEIVEHAWIRPVDALDPARGLKLLNVTRRLLEKLSTFGTAQDCLVHARGLREVRLELPRLANGPAGLRPVNVGEPAHAEIGLVDPQGQGHARYALEAGLVMRLAPRVWRVTAGEADGSAGAHSYFVGGTDGPWALIDPLPGDAAHASALRAAAPGPVRWILFTNDAGIGDLDAQLQAAWPEATRAGATPGESL
ncbi:MAG TPA: NUDIX domain-containing protein, partial [Variovorax sp.]|nr:NUDIX domain-containing protein [Variovorax sp.]